MKVRPRRNANEFQTGELPPTTAVPIVPDRRPTRVRPTPTAPVPPPKVVEKSAAAAEPRQRINTAFTRAKYWTRDTSATLVSLVCHTIILLILMSFAHSIGNGNSNGLTIIATGQSDSASDIRFDLEAPNEDAANPLDNATEMASRIDSAELQTSQMGSQAGIGQPALTLSNTTASSSGLSMNTFDSSSQSQFVIPTGEVFGGFSLEGRSAGKRAEMAMANGGDAATEAAVEAAIAWLIKHQYRDGSWSTFQDHGPECDCKNNAPAMFQRGDFPRPRVVAGTGLALLVLMGAGYTHREGPYRDEVYRALQFLLDTQKNGEPTPQDPRAVGQFTLSGSLDMMYEQGIATFALCEAYQMTKDDWLKSGSQRAINYLRAAQCYDGSWGYFPGQTGDLSIVGWQMMALRSAAASGLEVPPTEIRRIDGFLNSRSMDGGITYNYRGGRANPEMTAIGALMRLMRGWSVTDPRITKSINYVVYRDAGPIDDGPELTDVYFNYYATNLLFYSQSNLWPGWNARMKEIYLNSQCTAGHEAGSWFKTDPTGMVGFTDGGDRGINTKGGRLYTTCMAALTLEVYYRILPITKDDSKIDFKL